jgi:hypothetical protein
MKTKQQPRFYVRHQPPESETVMVERVTAPGPGNAFAQVLKLYPETHLIDAERTGIGVTGNFILRYDAPSTCTVDVSANGMANESYEQDAMPFFNYPEIKRERRTFR